MHLIKQKNTALEDRYKKLKSENIELEKNVVQMQNRIEELENDKENLQTKWSKTSSKVILLIDLLIQINISI